MLLKRLLALFALFSGLLGVVACMAGAYAVCLVGSRLQQTNEVAFTAIDRGLSAAQDRVRGVQERVKDLTITTSEIDKGVRDWAKKKADERLVSRADLDRRAEKLAERLQTADSFLEASTETIRGIQQILELGNSLGASLDPASLTDVVQKLQEIRGQLQQTDRALDGIREFLAGMEDGSEPSRLARVGKLLARSPLVTTGIDSRLENAVTRLDEWRSHTEELKARTARRILLATIACWLLLAWVAAGQIALCLWGMRKWPNTAK
jgi:DNA-binding transcriptional MerR regulator